ncbi:glycoside hydrolase family 24 protein [Massariosphaeria phaeospora]|uniref:Glycoside hydrolase family 24 protein n=1 Tax=Massariosphaeria phaeospora TaxID=100035 RepID=A0A7C8IGL5_9PLEO|nr:glycoside hydrolase family 24 protein [Massariosphaeria phaeospora]
MYTQLLAVGFALLPATFAAPIEARQCTGPNVNAATVALIKEFEGFVASPEPDPIGLPTVGYGHLCKTEGCGEVPYPFPLTEATATQLMQDDLKSPQQAITLDTASAVVLNANQYGALVSWAFNVGNGNVKSSTLIQRLNAGEDEATVIAQELPKWNKAGGQTLPGLVRRRAAEVDLAQTATSAPAIPACS